MDERQAAGHDRRAEPGSDALDEAQRSGRGDMPPEEFRASLHAVADLMADYLEHVERFSVLPDVRPGDVLRAISRPPPERPEPLSRILADHVRHIEPNVTHWQHPGFFAYFPSSASAPGILGEMLTSTLVANAMLWRTSPAASELEELTVGWLRDAMGLPPRFDGFYTDTASTSSLIGLAAARQASGGDPAARGLATGPRLRVYASEEAHSSIDKAAMTLGIGRDGVRRVATDSELRMDVRALVAAIEQDRRDGWQPCAIVSTIGTTSSTSVDPTADIAEVAGRERLWLHVDAAYAGAAALLPECRTRFGGWESADSIVVNPHKWLFTPLDCSLFLTRRPDVVRASFSLVPEYLRTVGDGQKGRDFTEYAPQLGRRFRALKIWFQLRYFGLSGLRARIARHIELAGTFADLVDREPDAERLADVPFSTVCFRWRPHELRGREDEPDVAAFLDSLNERIMGAVNSGGEIFISHTRLRGRFTLRLAVGGLRTEARHVERAWELLRNAGRDTEAAMAALAPAAGPAAG